MPVFLLFPCIPSTCALVPFPCALVLHCAGQRLPHHVPPGPLRRRALPQHPGTRLPCLAALPGRPAHLTSQRPVLHPSTPDVHCCPMLSTGRRNPLLTCPPWPASPCPVCCLHYLMLPAAPLAAAAPGHEGLPRARHRPGRAARQAGADGAAGGAAGGPQAPGAGQARQEDAAGWAGAGHGQGRIEGAGLGQGRLGRPWLPPSHRWWPCRPGTDVLPLLPPPAGDGPPDTAARVPHQPAQATH